MVSNRVNRLCFRIREALCLGVICLFWACASQGSLSGGPKDETPPSLVAAASDSNYQVSFRKTGFKLVFDEFVKVEDVFRQVIVTPPLVYNPKIEARGKTVYFTFNPKEVLRENTTYIIQFGAAVRDYNESNAAKDLDFVFSTGPAIDSAFVKGRIIDAITGLPMQDAYAMLYDSLWDSLIYKSRPIYFARSGADGSFVLRNLRPGTYRMAGLKDENQNYRFDQPQEKAGFFEGTIELADSIDGIELRLFEEEKPRVLQDTDSSRQGVLVLRYNESLEGARPFGYPDHVRIAHEIRGNQLTLWHDADTLTTWRLYLELPGGRTDSLRLRSYPLDSTMKRMPLTCSWPGLPGKSPHPDSIQYFRFSWPYNQISIQDTRLVRDTDSIEVAQAIRISGSDPLLWEMQAPAPGKYQWYLPPGSVTDRAGRTNDTAVVCVFRIEEPAAFSSLSLLLTDMDTSKQYVMRLLQQDKLIASWTVKETESEKRVFKNLLPDKYVLEITDDSNGNGRWDAGKYIERRLPERRWKRDLSQLRANWDIEEAVSVEDRAPVVGEPETQEIKE